VEPKPIFPSGRSFVFYSSLVANFFWLKTKWRKLSCKQLSSFTALNLNAMRKQPNYLQSQFFVCLLSKLTHVLFKTLYRQNFAGRSCGARRMVSWPVVVGQFLVLLDRWLLAPIVADVVVVLLMMVVMVAAMMVVLMGGGQSGSSLLRQLNLLLVVLLGLDDGVCMWYPIGRSEKWV
jgi:hypothetical protein